MRMPPSLQPAKRAAYVSPAPGPPVRAGFARDGVAVRKRWVKKGMRASPSGATEDLPLFATESR